MTLAFPSRLCFWNLKNSQHSDHRLRHPRDRPDAGGPLSGLVVGQLLGSDHNDGHCVPALPVLPTRDQTHHRRLQRDGDVRAAVRRRVQNRECFWNPRFAPPE